MPEEHVHFERRADAGPDTDTFRYFYYFIAPWSAPVAGIRMVQPSVKPRSDMERYVPFVFESDGRSRMGAQPKVWPPYSPALDERYHEFLEAGIDTEVGPVWTEKERPVVILNASGWGPQERQSQLVHERVREEYDVLCAVSPRLTTGGLGVALRKEYPVTDWGDVRARTVHLIYHAGSLAKELARLGNRVFVAPAVDGKLLTDVESEGFKQREDHRQSTRLLDRSNLLEFLERSELMEEPSGFDPGPRFNIVQGAPAVKKTSSGLLSALEELDLEVRYRRHHKSFEVSRDQGSTWTSLGEDQMAVLRDHIARYFSSDVDSKYDAWFDDERWENAWHVLRVIRAVD